MHNYLLADENGWTRRGTRVVPGRFLQSRHHGMDLISWNTKECSTSPLLAVMINPWHAKIAHPRLYEIQCSQVAFVRDDPKLNLHIREVTVPAVTPEQKVAFAALVVREQCGERVFINWTERWLSGRDRSAAGVRFMFSALKNMANDADVVIASLETLSTGTSDVDDVRQREADYLRRATDVVLAALALADRPTAWEEKMAKAVAAAVSGLKEESELTALAELAVTLVPAETERRAIPDNVIRPPQRLLRRRRRDDLSLGAEGIDTRAHLEGAANVPDHESIIHQNDRTS